jgi:hypothetical protein
MGDTSTSNRTELDRLTDKLHNKYIGIEPMLLIVVIALIIIYYYLFSSLGNNEEGKSSSVKVFFETMLWLLFIILLLLNGISYIFGIDVIKKLKSMFGYKSVALNVSEDKDENKLDIDLILKSKDQVFFLPDQNYTYDDSRAVCTAYDARLAKFDEVTDAYNSGADWCSYGWSEGQMALFPTQQEKWNKLQTKPGHEKDCGHPGVNGGYIDDVGLKFGVNCFGVKPPITREDAAGMRNKPFYNKTDKEKKFDKQVDYWRNKISQIIVAPFNHDNWSML